MLEGMTRVRLACMTRPPVIAPEGELDLYSVQGLTPQLDEAARADNPRLILDLSGVTLVDSSAFGTLVEAQDRFGGQGRTLSVVAPNGSAAAVMLELTGLRSRFSVFQSRDDALA
jgi:anti-sigma B factor antagonist